MARYCKSLRVFLAACAATALWGCLPDDRISGIRFSPDGARIAILSEKKGLRSVDIGTSEAVNQVRVFTLENSLAADLAGVSRLQYPPDFRIIRVPCSARVSPKLILAALRHGADGVWVSG